MSRILAIVALVAALVLTAQAEWTLAMAVGWSVYVAWAAPVTLDAYVVAAFRAGRDRGWALALMSAAVFAAHAAPVAFPGGFPWWLAGACSVVPPIVAWRVHELWLGDRHTDPIEAQPIESAPILAPILPTDRPDPIGSPIEPVPDPIPIRSAPRSAQVSGSKANGSGQPRRSDDQLRIELARAQDLGLVAKDKPTADAIREVLQVAPKKARQLRDELRSETPAGNDQGVVGG